MKRSTTNIALVCFTLVLVLSVYGTVMLPSAYHPTYSIYATKLKDKPTNYFALDKPDKYFLEAIAKNYSSVFNTLDDTQIDELVSEYATDNVQYNGTYYSVAIAIGDNFPPFMLPQALLGGIVISISAIIIVSVWKAAKHFKHSQKDFEKRD